MDGFEVLKSLKEKGQNVPIIVTSNLGQTEDIKKAKKLGAKEFWVKSNITLADIVDKVTLLLSS